MHHSTMADPREQDRYRYKRHAQRKALFEAIITLDTASNEPWNEADVTPVAALARRRLTTKAEQAWLIGAFLRELSDEGRITQDPETLTYRLNEAGRDYCARFINAP